MKILYELLIVSLMLASCSQLVGQIYHSDLEGIIQKSNVVYDSASFQTGHMHIPPYVANGIVGGCFDHMGFQSHPNHGYPNGRTVFGYIDHYYMHEATSRQFQLPLASIQAEFADGSPLYNMMEAENYRQELDIYNGVLTTSYDLYGSTVIQTFAHQVYPNLFVLKIDREATSKEKEFILKVECEMAGSQNKKWAPTQDTKLWFEIDDDGATIWSATNMVETKWKILTSCKIEQEGTQLHLYLANKENEIQFWVDRPGLKMRTGETESFEDLLVSHQEKWNQNWQKCWIDFPTERAHHVWNRGNYYNLSNFPVVPGKALIPTGMNGNIWGFTFPQDVYYVAENLLRSGHFDRYKKSMKYWLDILPEVKKYSKRIMDVEGGFYPWTPPFDQWDEFEKNAVVGNDSYEIHNPAYVAAMVWHYYQMTGDMEFLIKYFPIIEEVWRFYSNVTHENDLGTFDVNHHKAAGQDEASKLPSSKNLLCASYSAEYTLRNYLNAAELVGQYNEHLHARAQKVMKAGYERSRLLNEKGYYVTYEGDNRPVNSQKHPVQLNAIAFCPMADLGNAAPSLTAYESRYDLTSEAKKPVSHGWTYAEFSLASSRLGNPAGLKSDLSAAQYCAHADPRWIQFYEYTFWERWTLSTAYYFVTHGLYQQAYSDAIVQDWQGYTEIFACMLKEWKNSRFSFNGLHTFNGVSIDGTWDHGKTKLIIHPNGAKEMSLKISNVNDDLILQSIDGEQKVESGKVITLKFNNNEPIIIHNP